MSRNVGRTIVRVVSGLRYLLHRRTKLSENAGLQDTRLHRHDPILSRSFLRPLQQLYAVCETSGARISFTMYSKDTPHNSEDFLDEQRRIRGSLIASWVLALMALGSRFVARKLVSGMMIGFSSQLLCVLKRDSLAIC